LIRRRHVFYVEGYDPQGAAGYYRMFRREWKRFVDTWRVTSTVGEPVIDSDDFAHWNVDTAGPNWRVETRYEFLRMEAFIGGNMAQPLVRQVPRALRWMAGDLACGVLLRIFRAAWRFGLHLIFPQLLLLAWILTSVGGGTMVGIAAARWAGVPPFAAVILGVAAGVAIFAALRPLADRWFVVQVTNGWPYLREFARGAPSGFDRSVEALAQRLVEAARGGIADELLVVSHSAGCVISPAIVARALELDPALGQHGPKVALMTVGSLMPAFALHPAAQRLRAAIRRIAIEPTVLWVDCQARKDVMNFWDFDPVAGVGIEVGTERRNPTVWIVRFRDMLSDPVYQRLRFSYFRMHYQFVMGNDQRGSYDYFMLVCGPATAASWATRPDETFHQFSADAAYAGAAVTVAAAG
jgi:hypothetical protein